MSKKYELRLARKAKKQLKTIDRKDAERLLVAIEKLRLDPYPFGHKKLMGRDAFRVRVGVYRIIYEVNDEVLIVFVVTLGHRKEVYRK